MENRKLTFLDWLGFNRNFDFSANRWLGNLIGFALFVLSLIIAIVAVVAVFQLLGSMMGFGQFSSDITGAAIRNLGLFLFALFGAPFLVWRSIVAQQKVKVAEQSQITDRINKAVEGLGAEKTVKKIYETPRYKKDDNGTWLRNDDGEPIPATRPDGKDIVDRKVYESTEPNLEVRIGSIYALERIAQDSLRDHIQIMEILCAYIRENAPCLDLTPNVLPFRLDAPRFDIQAAITVIGRRLPEQIDLEWKKRIRLDLSGSNLSRIDFSEGDFSAVKFIASRFEGASFRRSRLHGADFMRSLLNFVDFYDAELTGTRFDFSKINKPMNPPGVMSESITFAKFRGVTVIGADISAINYLGENEISNLIFGSLNTRLHHDLEFDRKFCSKKLKEIRKLKMTGDLKKAENLERDLYKNNPFVDWSPHDHEDLETNVMYKKFKTRVGLSGFPYES